MKKTVKQICEEQGILGQIILERWDSGYYDIEDNSFANGPFYGYIRDFADWSKQLEPEWFWNTLFGLIREKELKSNSLSKQIIDIKQPSKLAKEIMKSFESVSIEPKSISKGSIVTIDGKEYELQGDAVPVKQVTKLVQGKRYLVKYTNQFVHSSGFSLGLDNTSNPISVVFVGENEGNNIFYDGTGSYFMFSGVNLNYIVKQLD